MPDWNPAEIIGFHPHLFSYSLYKYLVTDNAWAKAREEMGYKNISNYPLMYSFSGKPYRYCLSFNSLLPKNINNILSNKITTFWTNSLIKKPYFHDKIEFEITENCYHFKLPKVIRKKYSFLKTKKKKILFSESLKFLTNNILSNYYRDFNSYSEKIMFLENEG